MFDDDLRSATQSWIAHDPDARDRLELSALLATAEAGDQAATAELADRMAGPLTFGTAGLRGAIGAGRARMNTAVVRVATAALCTVLNAEVADGFHVVIGHDARYRSAEFARTAAAVVTAAGGRASLLPVAAPTPLTAFAVGQLAAEAGVMITASHNPPADNGYKVYLGGQMVPADERGAQLVSPTDQRIMAAILAAPPADQVPVATGGWQVLDGGIMDDYVAAAAALDARLAPSRAGEPAGLRVVLTAMHGVGAELAALVLARRGFTDLHLVAEQCTPDPRFPTVAFPNPEEPGALDLAIDLARTVEADLVVALDPDADRCSLAVPDGQRGWRQLSGDEVGVLLGDYVARAHAGTPGASLARSIVSGSLLDRIAEGHGLHAEQTLTGFKWIARAPGIVYGYEEAIGYCANPAVVRDKDGITAALLACRLAAIARADGSTLLDLLDELALRYGLHATAPLSFRVADTQLIGQGLQRLADNPPKELAGAQVVEFFDLSQGYLGLEPTPGYRIQTSNHDRVVVRPSGTEPLLKCYLEVIEPVGGREDLPGARQAATARLEAIKAQLTGLLGF